jgi:adenylosuccinate lyase
MVTENILMEAVTAGGDRQELHEALRKHSMEAARIVKEEGGKNDLLERIALDPLFSNIKSKLKDISNPDKLVGRAPQQVEEFVSQVVAPLLKRHSGCIDKKHITALHV